jgi:hypothetical protein
MRSLAARDELTIGNLFLIYQKIYNHILPGNSEESQILKMCE